MSNLDFRALCAALLDEIPYESPTTCLARAALEADTNPAAMSDDELVLAYSRTLAAHLDALGRPIAEPDFDAAQAAGLRAVLARYSTPSPVLVVAQPVSMRDRHPRQEDCDDQRRCWTTHFNPKHVYTPVWGMTELPKEELGHNFANAYFWKSVTHWLPHWALLLPEAQP